MSLAITKIKVFYKYITGLIKKKSFKRFYAKQVIRIRKHPLLSFCLVLFLLFLLILVGNILSFKKTQVVASNKPQQVQVYSIGKAPTLTVNAKIDKSGVIKITSQTSGVVQEINVNEGDEVGQGTQIVSLSTNDQGGNVPALQAQLAQDQLQNTNETYSEQSDIIQKQRDIANNQDENASDLRNIQNQSIADTQSLLNLNNQILQTLQQNLANDPTNLQDQELVAQYQNSVNGLNSTIQNTQYQASNTNPPAVLADEQRDLTLKQLDVQQKSLDLSREMNQVQLSIAQVNEAMMFPSTPIAGTVDKIYVRVGQAVTPGTVIAQVTGDTQAITAVASIPQNIANRITAVENSQLHIGNSIFEEVPLYVSGEATDNNLYTVTYQVPSQYANQVSDGGYIQIAIPVGTGNTSASDPFVPIDAIFQTQTDSYLFIVDHKVAKAEKVQLGQVFGDYTEILSGLKNGDQVILDRNIIAGTKVSPTP